MGEGGVLVVGRVDGRGLVDGPGVVYLYPGLWLAIVGSYAAGHLTAGREGFLAGTRPDPETGMPVPEVRLLQNSRRLTYEQPTSSSPGRDLMLRDLNDILHVYVGQSGVSGAGEGLFARQGGGTFDWSDLLLF